MLADLEVAPLVGAWIEISVATIPDKLISVAPLVGAWIEILHLRLFLHDIALSLPSWERGLKYTSTFSVALWAYVAPLVGAWIEIVFNLSRLS